MEISQLTTERDQLVRQLEKSQDMLLSFQQVLQGTMSSFYFSPPQLQDLNLTESELKRANEENRRLREETTLMPEKSVLDSKEKQIKKLNENIKNLEVEYDNILQQKDKEKMRADKLERDSKPINAKIEQLEADLKHALKMNDSQENNLSKDIAMFNQVNCPSSSQLHSSQTIQTAQALDSCSFVISEI